MSYLDRLTSARNAPICEHHFMLLRPVNRNGTGRGKHRATTSSIYRSSHFADAGTTTPVENLAEDLDDTRPLTEEKNDDFQILSQRVNGEDTTEVMSARSFLLSIAGMFDSGLSDGSEKIKMLVAETLARKYGQPDNGDVD